MPPKGPLGVPLDKALEWANTVNIFALILVAVAGAIVAVCTFLIIRWQSEQDNYKKSIFEHYKASVAGQVADASRQGLEAGRTASDAKTAAANAQIEIARANERAAKFEKDAAEARERTATLEAKADKTQTFAEGLAVQQQGIAKKFKPHRR